VKLLGASKFFIFNYFIFIFKELSLQCFLCFREEKRALETAVAKCAREVTNSRLDELRNLEPIPKRQAP
jgi:hypothetical protein